ncbi:MAG TPA: bifunctional phosphopantothenoylcysteine decarboxylase/phosphopantothenate--cysteine ligase CoaBC [Candidatus Limnocylindria bacterium]|nr:bifunctional phosphopantothenoylcysteine decarboxylase/phosphopantothenate--cysteine ligase CoaBC [Candidatus Limnocylindria bacterium]
MTIEPRRPLAGRRVVVAVSGSIAAYKAVLLVRQLLDRGAVVDVAMTPAATRFVGPLTFASLTHRPVVSDVMDLDPEQQIAHVELAEGADAIVVAPATANLIAELAAGMVHDAVTAVVCASRAPVIVAPAMDAGMWTHPATGRNVETLRSFGYRVVEPEVGELASGLTGIGRLAEPATIVDTVERLFLRSGDLDGLRVVVSAGGTREPIDPVRFIGNRSSGKMGVALAEAARDRGAQVTLVAGAMSVSPPRGVTVVEATTTASMRQAVLEAAPGADILVMAAAVADFAPARAQQRKIKRSGANLSVELVPNPDIVAEVGEMPDAVRPFIVGFAAESDDLEANAVGKLRDKGLDLIVGNRVGGPFDAIGSDENKVTVFGAEGTLTDWPMLPKRQLAERLWDLIADRYRTRDERPTAGPAARSRR